MGILDGRVAVITGSGGGIGAAIARLMAGEGAHVVINDIGVTLDGADAHTGPALALAQELTEAGGSALANTDDISDPDGAKNLIDSAIGTFGKLDVVVNVAGILRDRMVFNLGIEDWEAVLKVHMTGTFNTTKHASAHWRGLRDENANHRLINFSSTAGLFGGAGQPNYSAAKLGIVGFTYSCAKALAKYGVTSNAIVPSANTRMTSTIPTDQLATAGSRADLGPEHVGRVVAFLASEASGWCNGRVVGVRGRKITLYSNPRPEQVLVSREAWDFDAMQQEMEAVFRPAVEASPLLPA